MKRILSLFLAALLALNTSALCAAETQIGYINEDTKVYMDASEKAIVDGSAALGMQVRIEDETVSEGTGWYKVTFLASSKTGWVKADDVDLVIAKKAITASAQAPAVQGGVRPVERESDFPVLNASGIVDPSTLPQGSASLQYRDLSVGDSGEDVLAVSEMLVALPPKMSVKMIAPSAQVVNTSLSLAASFSTEVAVVTANVAKPSSVGLPIIKPAVSSNSWAN